MTALLKTIKPGRRRTLPRIYSWRSISSSRHALRARSPWRSLCLSGNRKGFTLVELLVTIAIMTILGAVALPVMSVIREKGKVIRCKAQIKELATAIEAYKMEYGTIPLWYKNGNLHTRDDDRYDTFALSHNTISNSPPVAPWTASSQFLRCLMGLPATWTGWEFKNPKGIRFFDPKPTPDGYEGLHEVGGEYAYNDPWGRGFAIFLDWDLDGHLMIDYRRTRWPFNPFTAQEPGHAVGKFDYLIMSKGEDITDPSDNVYSWK